LVSYNTRQLTENCLDSLCAHIDLNNVEIIVVDNASSDNSVEMIREKFSFVKLIENESNLGFAKANNIGVHHSSGEHILLLNTDTVIIEDFLSPILRYLEEVEDVGVLGCRVVSEDGSLQYTCWRTPNIFTGLSFFTVEIIKNIFNPFSYWRYMKYWDHASIKEVDCISGCFMWIRREVTETFGDLDENIFMYYEDTEYCTRLRKHSNFKVVYYPETSIVHLGGVSGDGNESNSQVLKYDYRSFNYFLTVNNGVAYQKLFRLLCEVIWRVELAFFYLLKNLFKFKKKYRLIKWMLSE
jgi:GT2 family glycosyltransferase